MQIYARHCTKLWRLDKLIHIKHLGPWLACINIQYIINIKLLVTLLEKILEVLIAMCILKSI